MPKDAKKKEGDGEKKKGGGLQKPLKLSKEMAAFMKTDIAARTEVVKAIWVYIKEKKLQDEQDKRTLNFDETLSKLMGVKSCNMFQMQKHLSPHFIKDEGDKK